MRLRFRPPPNAPLWGLTAAALVFWGVFNGLQHRAWFPAARDHVARPDGTFQERAPDAPPLPAVYLDNDSIYWLHHAETALAGGPWRPRRVAEDNVPYGRPNHWSSPLVWALAGTARIAATVTGRPATELLPQVAVWINPLLFAGILLGLARLLGRRLEPWSAGLLVLSLATLPPVMRSFSVLHVDHHGLVDVPALGMPLCLLLGLAGPLGPAARKWFVASGILGGLGLWFQASHQLIPLAATLLGLLAWAPLAAPARPARKNETAEDPLDSRLWRAWAGAGALVALAAYALEYFPAGGLQLDVNHPLYALAWFGATETALATARARRRGNWSRTERLTAFGGLLPAAAVLALMRFGPDRWFLVADPFLQRVHGQIREFQPLLGSLRDAHPALLFLLFNTLPLVALIGIRRRMSRPLPAPLRLGLQLALFALLPAFALCLRHARYSSLLAIALWLVAVAASLARPPGAGRDGRFALPLLLGLGAATGLLLALAPLAVVRQPFMPVDRWIPQMIQRDVARELAALPEFPGSRVLCGYALAPALQAFAGVQTTGGLYWENVEGLRAAAEFFAATDEAEARRLLRERGIRWIVLENRAGAPQTWLRIRFGDSFRADARATLAARLARPGPAPLGLERIPADRIPLAAQAAYQVFRVPEEKAPDQRPF